MICTGNVSRHYLSLFEIFVCGFRFEQNVKARKRPSHSEVKRIEGTTGIDPTVSSIGSWSLSPTPWYCHTQAWILNTYKAKRAIDLSALTAEFAMDSSRTLPIQITHSGIIREITVKKNRRKISLLDVFGSFHDSIKGKGNRGKSHIRPCCIGRFEYVGYVMRDWNMNTDGMSWIGNFLWGDWNKTLLHLDFTTLCYHNHWKQFICTEWKVRGEFTDWNRREWRLVILLHPNSKRIDFWAAIRLDFKNSIMQKTINCIWLWLGNATIYEFLST